MMLSELLVVLAHDGAIYEVREDLYVQETWQGALGTRDLAACTLQSSVCM